MDLRRHSHKKLLCHDLQTLTRNPTYPISTVEVLGVVAALHRNPARLLFLIDDATAAVPCVLWLNHRTAPFRLPNSDLAAEMAERDAGEVRLGTAVRVRGRVTYYKGKVQVTVRDVRAEVDPNAEVVHWLDCVRLGRSSCAPNQSNP